MVVGEGFEPSKSMTADLQSAPFGRSGTPPQGKFIMLLAFYSGKDYSELKLLTLRAVACGNVLSLSLESNLEVDDGRFAVSSLNDRSGTPPRGNANYWPASVGSGAHHIK